MEIPCKVRCLHCDKEFWAEKVHFNFAGEYLYCPNCKLYIDIADYMDYYYACSANKPSALEYVTESTATEIDATWDIDEVEVKKIFLRPCQVERLKRRKKR